MKIFAPLLAILMLTAGAGVSRAASPDLQWARENFKVGRYANALKRMETYLATEDGKKDIPNRAFYGELLLITGGYDQAIKFFSSLKNPTLPDKLLLVKSYSQRGKYLEAEKLCIEIFRADKNSSSQVRTMLISLLSRTGNREEAELSRNWFFENYRKISKIKYGKVQPEGKPKEVRDPAELIAMAEGIAPRDPQGAINALTCAQKLSPRDIRTYLASFQLFLANYAWGQAAKELAAALKINPKHPQVLLASAQQAWTRQKAADRAEKALQAALKINPNLVAARVMMAQLHLFDGENKAAKRELDLALKVNPEDLEALSVLAAYYYDSGKQEDFSRICARVLKTNSTYSELYYTLAGTCERKRQFPKARIFYDKAIKLDPSNWRGYYGAGMALVRRGEDVTGKKLLEKAFELNKYNLFCRNMLVVLDKLVPPEGASSQFEKLRTEHFLIFAPKKDAAFLLPYYARCLEEAYQRFHKDYDFTPENPTVVEVFNKHSHFSARTTGLPLIGADGACFGKLITLDSARVWQAESVPLFNWKAVAEHELMHVFSLQITNYNIPRWLTEGLSVFEERVPRIELDRLFTSAVGNNRLIKIKDLNRQMTRPTARANPILAYYQARRIVEHIYAAHGRPAMMKLLAECRKGQKIGPAIKAALGIDIEQLEKNVLKYQRDFARDKIRLIGTADPATVAKLQLAISQNPKDAASLAALADSLVQSSKPNWKQARIYATRALAAKTGGAAEAQANVVLGLISFNKDKKLRRARSHFTKAVAITPDDFRANLYLGICAGKEGQEQLAVKHLRHSIKISPRYIAKPNAYDELATVYRDLEDYDAALAVQKQRVAISKLDYDAAIDLAKLARRRKKYKIAAWACFQAIAVDPFKIDAHLIWGESAEKAKLFVVAEREWKLATLVDKTHTDARMGLARTLLAQGKKAAALRAAEDAKALEPDRPDIPQLIKLIQASEEKAPPSPAEKPIKKAPEAKPENEKLDLEPIGELQELGA
jgi:tetratricopeptide (TPR) repeat protein